MTKPRTKTIGPCIHDPSKLKNLKREMGADGYDYEGSQTNRKGQVTYFFRLIEPKGKNGRMQ